MNTRHSLDTTWFTVRGDGRWVMRAWCCCDPDRCYIVTAGQTQAQAQVSGWRAVRAHRGASYAAGPGAVMP